MRFLYWDDNLSDEILGTSIVIKKNMNYIENIEPHEKSKKRQTRPTKLYNEFKSLSRIEQTNFINLIRNHVTYGK